MVKTKNYIIIIKVPFSLLNNQNPRQIKAIKTINVENDAISGTDEFFFPQDFVLQRPGLSSMLKDVKGA
jgi:hypothetical protein